MLLVKEHPQHYELRHKISNNVVHTHSLITALASRLNIL